MVGLSFEVDPQEVLRLQGYRRSSDLPTREVLAILQDAMAEARHVLQPRWVYREFVVESVDLTGCRLDGGSTLWIREVPERWGPITTLGLAVCTIGEAIEHRIESLFAEREFPVAYMLDSLGSVVVEALAEAVLRQLCAERLSQGLKVTPRESPGYRRWPIEEQRKVFALLPADSVGMSLNPYCIMTPRKSISFAVGIGPEARMGSNSSPCQSCDMRGCAYRRVPRRNIAAPAWALSVNPLVLELSQSA
ncbi:MAG: hypothetical protein ACHQ7N_06545 [Candidatus Methylomirabilales bacterium]